MARLAKEAQEEDAEIRKVCKELGLQLVEVLVSQPAHHIIRYSLH